MKQKLSMEGELFRAILTEPDASLPWERLPAFLWWRDMALCPQDVIHHAEGDVATHTRMVVEALQADEKWQQIPAYERGVVLLAALLHDIGKPSTTREEAGRIMARGHSGRGEIMARRQLWESNAVPFAVREQVAALIRFHQHPFYLIERDDSRYQAIRISQTARCDHLALLAEADARGRICDDQDRMLLNVALFAAYCEEQGCFRGPYTFASDHSRFLYFRSGGERSPEYHAYEEAGRPEMILMSGMPGSGKDTYIRKHLPDVPMVSLDDIRDEIGVSVKDGQEPVLAVARDRTRALLRAGKSMVWNATSIHREIRDKRLRFADDYNARVRIIYVEVPASRLRSQNRSRDAEVPETAMERMLYRWEVPNRTEAHTTEYQVTEETLCSR